MGFTQGISGLKAAAADLDNIGNNIANSQTTGYKSSSTQFADIYANARTGLGVSVAGTAQDFSTGSLNTTDRNLDVAIDGGGFFRLSNNGATQYSRDGQFQQTKDGTLANSSGALLTGYNVDNFNNPVVAATVSASGTPQIIQLPAEGLNARATTQASLAAALDAGADKIDAGFDPNDTSTYNWSTPNTVYDSLGNAHSVNLYFTKSGENAWQVHGEMTLGSETSLPKSVPDSATGGLSDADTAKLQSASTGTYTVTIDGTDYTARVTGATDDGSGKYTGGTVAYTESLPATELSFDSSGNLETATTAGKSDDLADSQVAYTLNAQNGSAPIDFNFDFAGSSQTAQSFSAGSPSQDGYASGALTGITIQDNGMVTGSYDNGQSVNLAQIALASFRNENGLQPVSGNAWVQTAESGEPGLGTAGTGQFGDLRGGTLEASNVDLSQQLVDMIVSQRNYQANAQTIKTQDQVLQTAVNLR